MSSVIDMIPAGSRVLVIKPSSIGDIIHTLPAVAGLKKARPDLCVWWVVRSDFKGLVEDNPSLEGIVPFPRHVPLYRWPAEYFRFIRALREVKAAAAIDFQGLLRSAVFARVCGAPLRIGFADAREGAPAFYTINVQVRAVHALEKNKELIETLGIQIKEIDYGIQVDTYAAASLGKKLSQQDSAGKPLVLVNPFARWESKSLTAAAAVTLIRAVAENGFYPVVAGSSGFREAMDAVAAELNGVVHGDLVGRTTLPELSALIARASAVVSVDSGVIHLAAALNKPVAGIYGPTDPAKTGPYKGITFIVTNPQPCVPCLKRKCVNDKFCLTTLPVDDMMQFLKKNIHGN